MVEFVEVIACHSQLEALTDTKIYELYHKSNYYYYEKAKYCTALKKTLLLKKTPLIRHVCSQQRKTKHQKKKHKIFSAH